MTSNPREDSALALERAQALSELRRFSDAAALLAQIVATNPRNPTAWCLLAQAHLGLHDFAEMLEAAETAASLSPEDEWPQRLRSIALDGLGRPKDAVLAARVAVRLAPDTWQGFVQLAHAASRRKTRLFEARRASREALRLAPYEVESHLAAGAVATASRRLRKANAAYHRALAIDPDNAAAHNNLARIRLMNSSFGRASALADAAEGFATAVRSDPRAMRSRHNLDLVLRIFLTRVTYFILVDAYLVSRVFPAFHQPGVRAASSLLLAVPAIFASRFIRRLDPYLRGYLRQLLFHPKIRVAAALDVVAIVLLVAAAVLPKSGSDIAAGSAVAAALISRLMLSVQIEHTSRAARGIGKQPILSTAMLWIITISLLLTALLLFSAGSAGPIMTGLICITGGLGVVYVIRRRR